MSAPQHLTLFWVLHCDRDDDKFVLWPSANLFTRFLVSGILKPPSPPLFLQDGQPDVAFSLCEACDHEPDAGEGKCNRFERRTLICILLFFADDRPSSHVLGAPPRQCESSRLEVVEGHSRFGTAALPGSLQRPLRDQRLQEAAEEAHLVPGQCGCFIYQLFVE